MKDLNVKDIMRQTFFIDPDTTLHEAAKKMEEANCAILPIGTPAEMLGIITNRDLVIQSFMNGNHEKLVKDYMNEDITFCKEDAKLKDAAHLMEENNTNFVFIKNENGRVTGKISFEELLSNSDNNEEIEKIAHRVSRKTAA